MKPILKLSFSHAEPLTRSSFAHMIKMAIDIEQLVKSKYTISHIEMSSNTLHEMAQLSRQPDESESLQPVESETLLRYMVTVFPTVKFMVGLGLGNAVVFAEAHNDQEANNGH